MKIVVPFTRVGPATIAALADYLPDEVTFADVSTSDTDYQQMLERLWDEGESVIICEHDIVPWRGAIEQIRVCEHYWCYYAYHCAVGQRHVGTPPFGLVKFSKQFIEDTRDVWKLHRDNRAGFLARHQRTSAAVGWNCLDCFLFSYATMEHGLIAHQHWPSVLNLNGRPMSIIGRDTPPEEPSGGEWSSGGTCYASAAPTRIPAPADDQPIDPIEPDGLKTVKTSLYLRMPGTRRQPCELDDIAMRHGTDKAGNGHDYCRIYEPLFRPLRDKPITLLELGVDHGASIMLWHEYFQKATIVGVDLFLPDMDVSRVHLYQCDQSDQRLLELIGHHDLFDIIIDDCSHRANHTITSFNMLWWRVKPGGLYIIEDITQSLTDPAPTTVDFVKSLADDVQRTRWRDFDVDWIRLYYDLAILRRRTASWNS